MDTSKRSAQTRRSQRQAAMKKAPYAHIDSSASSTDPASVTPLHNETLSYWKKRLSRFINPWRHESGDEDNDTANDDITPMDVDQSAQSSSNSDSNDMEVDEPETTEAPTVEVPTVEVTEATEVTEVTEVIVATETVEVVVVEASEALEVSEGVETPRTIDGSEVADDTEASDAVSVTETPKKRRAKRSPAPTSTRTTRRTRSRAVADSEDIEESTPAEEQLHSESHNELPSESHSESHPEPLSEPHLESYSELHPESHTESHSEHQLATSKHSENDDEGRKQDSSDDIQQQNIRLEVPQEPFEDAAPVAIAVASLHSKSPFAELHESDEEHSEDDQTFHSTAQFDTTNAIEIKDSESEGPRSPSIDYEETKYYPPEDDEDEGIDAVKYYPPDSEEEGEGSVQRRMSEQPLTPSQESHHTETSKVTYDIDSEDHRQSPSPPAISSVPTRYSTDSEGFEFSPAPSRPVTREPEALVQPSKESIVENPLSMPQENKLQNLVNSNLSKLGNIEFLAAFFEKQRAKGTLLSRKQAAQITDLINDSLIPAKEDDSISEQADVVSVAHIPPVKRPRHHIAPFSVVREHQSVGDQYHESSKEVRKQAPLPSMEEYLEIEKYNGVEWDRLPSYLKVRRYIEWKGTESPEVVRKRKIQEVEQMRQWKAKALSEDARAEGTSTDKKQAALDSYDSQDEDSEDHLRRRRRKSQCTNAAKAAANSDEQPTKAGRLPKTTSVAQTLLEIAGKRPQVDEAATTEEHSATPSAPGSPEMSSSVYSSEMAVDDPSDSTPKSTKVSAMETSSSSPSVGQSKTELRPASSSSSPFGFTAPASKNSALSSSVFSSSAAPPTFSFATPAFAVAAASTVVPLSQAASSSASLFSFSQPSKPSASTPSGSGTAEAPKFNFGFPSSTSSAFAKNKDSSVFDAPAKANPFAATTTSSSRTPSPATTPELTSRRIKANTGFGYESSSEHGGDDSESQLHSGQDADVEVYEDQDEDELYDEYDEQGDDDGEEDEGHGSWTSGSRAQGGRYSRDDSPADPDADSDKENQGPPAGWGSRPSVYFSSQVSFSQSAPARAEHIQTRALSPAAAHPHPQSVPKTPDFSFDFNRFGRASGNKSPTKSFTAIATAATIARASSLPKRPLVYNDNDDDNDDDDDNDSVASGDLRVGDPVNPGYMSDEGWRFKGDTFDMISDYEKAPLVCDDETFYTDQGRISPLASPTLPPRSA